MANNHLKIGLRLWALTFEKIMELLLASMRFVRTGTGHRTNIPTRFIATFPRTPPLFPPARRHYEYVLPDPTSDKSKSNARTSDRRPTNHHIPFDHVFVIDPETKKLSETKKSLKELLESRQRNVIELVASTPQPIVRITTRNEIEARYKEKKQAMKKGTKKSEEPKEVQLTWGVARADLEHKLRKAKRDLEKGYRVVVVVSMKKGHRPPDRGKLVTFADEISESISEAGKEWKEREFSDRLMVLSFQGAKEVP